MDEAACIQHWNTKIEKEDRERGRTKGGREGGRDTHLCSRKTKNAYGCCFVYSILQY